MASQTTCICCVEMPRPFRNERAALAPSTSKRFSAVYRSVKPRSCRIVATANNSASGARSALSESNTPNSQERITWLKRNGSDALRDKSIASRTRTVSGTLIPAKTISCLPRSAIAGYQLAERIEFTHLLAFLLIWAAQKALPSKSLRGQVAPSHAARLDTVEHGVVPVSVEPCDFGVRVETQNVAVRDVYVLALLCNPRHFGRHGPAHLGLDHHCVPLGGDQFDHFDSEVRNGIRKRAPNNIDATTDRHDALAAIRSISS